MANPFSIDVPDALKMLMMSRQGYEQGRERGFDMAREQAVASMPNSPIARLMAAGDLQGAQVLSSMQNATADRDWRRAEADRAQRNSDRTFNLQERALTQKAPTELERRAIAGGLQPGSPQYHEFMLRGGRNADVLPSAVDKKAIYEAEDAVPQLQGTVEALDRALDLNDKTFTGYTAGMRGKLGANIPGGGLLVDRDAALATEEWSKIMGPEALQTMASTLKGATTDFELRKFIEMLGNPDTAPNIRKSIIERMKTLATRKLELSNRRIQDLRGGTYFKPEGAPSGGAITKEQYDALPPGTPFIAPDGSRRVKP